MSSDPPAAPRSPAWIFDRDASAGHPWEGALDGLGASGDAAQKAVCANVRMDHRVSDARESDLLSSGHFSSAPTPEEWPAQMRTYYRAALCRPSNAASTGQISAYVEASNQTNLIAADIPKFDQLAHAASLNTILRRLSSGESSRTQHFKSTFKHTFGLALPARPPGMPTWTTDHFNVLVDGFVKNLQEQGPDAIKEVAGFLNDALGAEQPPWWACFAEEIKDALNGDDRTPLCQSLGLGHISVNDWILTWRYEVAEAGPLYRPTVIESNLSPYHFPAPPTCLCGITMPLDHPLPRCREVLHSPLRGRPAIEACTGDLGKVYTPPLNDYSILPFLRGSHNARLERDFTKTEDQNWFDRHT